MPHMAVFAPSSEWYFDDEVLPTTVVICPSTCSSLSGGKISILLGCL